jgi:hypothetical protein
VITAKFQNDDTKTTTILLTLEPGNLEALLRGEPVFKFLMEFVPNCPRIKLVLAYTPDAHWVAEQVRQGDELLTLLAEAKQRKPVLRISAEMDEVL